MKKTVGILCVLLACLINSASADIYLVFEYDQQTDTTMATYSGSWNTFQIDYTNPIGGNWSVMYPDRFISFEYGTSYSMDAGVSVNDGASLPWNNVTSLITGRTGDNFGFGSDSAGNLYAPAGYVAGTAISGTLIFAGSDLTDLGLSTSDSEIISVAGVGNDIHLAVPEPATALSLAIGGGLLAIIRRMTTA